MKHYIALIAALLSVTTTTFAAPEDNIHNEVTITKDFTPVVREAEKITTQPSEATPIFRRSAVTYNYDILTAEVPTIASNLNIPFSRLNDRYYTHHRGYADVAMGTYLAMTANTGYRILDTNKDRLNIGLQYTSLNWDIPVNSYASDIAEEKTRQTFYDLRIGAHYAHTFGNNITAAINGSYRLAHFNYYGAAGNQPTLCETHPFQTANNIFIEAQVDNHKARSYDFEQWSATGGYALYTNNTGAYLPTPSTEHHAYLKGTYSRLLTDEWSVGGEINLDYLHYINILGSSSNLSTLPETYSDNIFMARLLPHIDWNKGRMHFRAGVKIDISTGDGTIFRFAPDIHFNWEFVRNYFLYATIDGGKRLHTWDEMSKYCLYFDPSQRIPSSYTPLDARLGFRLHFIPEVSLSAYAGYEAATGALFQSVGTASQAIAWQSLKANCIKGGVRLDANITRYIDLSADVTYRLWRHNREVISYNRPRWEGNVKVTIHPHKQFNIDLGYNMQLDRDFGQWGKLADIHNLQAAVTYFPIDWISVFIQGNNLLNCKYDYYYGLAAPRIQAMVGVGIKF